MVLSIVATVVAGLSAGLFFSFSTGVMPGLARADDRSYVDSMRGINNAVINGLFLGAVFGAPLLLMAASGAALFTATETTPTMLLLAAAAISLIGTGLVTGAVNVPLNNRLAISTERDVDVRRAFHEKWVRANHVRTLASLLALVCAVIAVALL